MRRGLIFASVAAIVVLGGGLYLGSRTQDDGRTAADNGTGLETRTATAGEVDIEVDPRQLDDEGAAFAVSLDTHSVELSMDLTTAVLEVSGTRWPVTGWDGDEPDGHHREGELRFEAAGPAVGTARLVLAGFAEPVEASWDLGG